MAHLLRVTCVFPTPHIEIVQALVQGQADVKLKVNPETQSYRAHADFPFLPQNSGGVTALRLARQNSENMNEDQIQRQKSVVDLLSKVDIDGGSIDGSHQGVESAKTGEKEAVKEIKALKKIADSAEPCCVLL